MALAWSLLSCHQTDNPVPFCGWCESHDQLFASARRVRFQSYRFVRSLVTIHASGSSLTFRSGAHAHTDENVGDLIYASNWPIPVFNSLHRYKLRFSLGKLAICAIFNSL